VQILITGGRLIDPANTIDTTTDLAIADGKVVAIGQLPEGFNPERTIDATGLVVCPGLIDLAARMREPGLEYKADIHSESRAAAAGGIATLCQPPDTDPVTDTPAVAELVQKRGRQAGYSRILPIGALTQGLAGEQLSEMVDLKQAGCRAVSNVRAPIANTLVLRRAFEYAATHNLVVFIHPEDHALSNHGCAHEGAMATRLGLPGIPEAAETAAVASSLALIRQTGVSAHFCRLSTAHAVQMVSRAREDGLPVTADVAAHQLHLTDEALGAFDSNYHLLPPLRDESDRVGLRAGVINGTITAICSDHQPHEADAKLAPFPATEPGISALETLLPLALQLCTEDEMPLSDLIARLTSGPAAILGTDSGHLAVGATADITLFNPSQSWTATRDLFLSRGHNTPFMGRELTGQTHYTLMDGRIIYERQPN